MYKKLAALLIATVMISSTAFGQLYKADYATKLVLAGMGGPGLPNKITFTAPAIAADQNYVWPLTMGGGNYVLKTDGAGNLDWVNLNTLGITSITGTDPIHVVTVAGAATVSIDQGSLLTTSPGITITGTGKTVDANISINLNTGDLTVNGAGLSVTGGTGSVIGSGAQVSLATSNLTAGSDAISIGSGSNKLVGLGGASVTLSTDASLLQTGGQLILNTGHNNNWNSIQTITGEGSGLVVDADANLTLQGHGAAAGYVMTSDLNGVASWTNLSSIGVTSIQGTANEILVNGDLASHTGTITLTTPQPIATTSNVTFGSATLGNLAFSQPVHSDGAGKLVSGAINLAGGATEVSGKLPVANGGTNSNTSLSGSSIMISNGSAIVQGEYGTTTTVLHGNNSGAPSYSSIVDNDIATGTISNGKLVNNSITVASPNGSLTVPGVATALGGTANVDIDVTHDNNWASNQTITGASHTLKVETSANFALEGHNANTGRVLTSTGTGGVATWTDLSAVGVTAITGTANQVIANGNVGTNEVGHVTLTLPQSIATTSTVTFNDIFLTNLSGTGGIVQSDGNGHLFNNPVLLSNGGQVSGLLPVSNGGTGSGSFNGNRIVISNAAGDALISGTAGTTTTVLHGNASGAPTYGQIVDGDIASGTISNNKLANNTIDITSTDNSLVVTGTPIALGGSGDLALDMTHPNTWTATQAVTGLNHELRVDDNAQMIVASDANFAVAGHGADAGYVLTSTNTNGDATWTNLSSLGITSVVGDDPIQVNTTSGVATVSIDQGNLTTSTPAGITITGTGRTVDADINIALNTGDLTVNGAGLSVTGGTGAVIGGGAQVSLATGNLTAGSNALSVTGGTNAVVGAGASVSLATDASLVQTGGQLKINTAHANDWSGTQTFGATGNNAGVVALANTGNDNVTLGAANTLYTISSAVNTNLTGLQDGFAGRTITLYNAGSSYITIKSQDANSNLSNRFAIAGGDDAIMGPGATATFMYLNGQWTLVSGF